MSPQITKPQKESELPVLANEINAAHAKCEAAVRDGLAHAMEAGRLLLEAKEQVGHGEWIDWIEVNCQFSARTAQGYMRLARHYAGQKTQRVAHLPLRAALALIAEPKPLRDEMFPAARKAVNVLQEDLAAAEAMAETDPARAVAMLIAVAQAAGDMQNQIAAARLRVQRAAGQLLAEGIEQPEIDERLRPPSRDSAICVIEPAPGVDLCRLMFIVPYSDPGYLFVTCTEQDSSNEWSFVGGKKPMLADVALQRATRRLRGWDGYEVEPVDSPDELLGTMPWDRNYLLFPTDKDHLHHGLGIRSQQMRELTING